MTAGLKQQSVINFSEMLLHREFADQIKAKVIGNSPQLDLR